MLSSPPGGLFCCFGLLPFGLCNGLRRLPLSLRHALRFESRQFSGFFFAGKPSRFPLSDTLIPRLDDRLSSSAPFNSGQILGAGS